MIYNYHETIIEFDKNYGYTIFLAVMIFVNIKQEILRSINGIWSVI